MHSIDLYVHDAFLYAMSCTWQTMGYTFYECSCLLLFKYHERTANVTTKHGLNMYYANSVALAENYIMGGSIPSLSFSMHYFCEYFVLNNSEPST